MNQSTRTAVLTLGLLASALSGGAAHAEEGLVVDLPRYFEKSKAGRAARARVEEKKSADAGAKAIEAADREEIGALIKAVEPALIAASKAKKHAVLFERSGAEIVYAAPGIDVTDALVVASDGGKLEGFAPPAADRTLRVAYVDLGRALQTTKQGQAKKAELVAQHQRSQAEIDAGTNKVKALMAKAAAVTAGTPERAELDRQVEKESQSLAWLYESRKFELEFAEKQAVKDLMTGIEPLVKSFAERDGHTLVLSATGTQVLHADARLDITDEVVRAFDAGEMPPKPKLSRPRVATKLAFVDLPRVQEAWAKRKGGPFKDQAEVDASFAAVKKAAAEVAQKEGLHLVLGREGDTAFYVRPDLDLTAKVIAIALPESPQAKPAPQPPKP